MNITQDNTVTDFSISIFCSDVFFITDLSLSSQTISIIHTLYFGGELSRFNGEYNLAGMGKNY